MKHKFTIFAWGVLAYTVAVILWGAFVRATGSGAGCGSHWPLCNGVVVPRTEQAETLIEFAHRLTSGAAGLLVLGMFVWAWRLYPKGHIVRLGAGLSLFFMATEALIGAGLVLLELVAHNDSAARAAAAAVHLVNSFLLLGVLALTPWWAGGGRPVRLKSQGAVGRLLGIGAAWFLILGASGAITALGDTLYPAGSLAEGVQQDFAATAHFLVRLRIWHPAIAIGLGLYLILAGFIISERRPHPTIIRLSRALKWLFIGQLGAGALNVVLLVPVWMQIVHLLLADIVWIVFVLLAANALAATEPAAEPDRRLISTLQSP